MMSNNDNNDVPKELSSMNNLTQKWVRSHSQSLPKNNEGGYQMNIDARFVKIYFGFTKRFGLKPVEAMLFALITSLSRLEETPCYMSKERMAGLLNVSTPTIFSALRTLMKKGVIERYYSPKSHKNGWRLTGSALDRLGFCKELAERYFQERNQKKDRNN